MVYSKIHYVMVKCWCILFWRQSIVEVCAELPHIGKTSLHGLRVFQFAQTDVALNVSKILMYRYTR